MDTPDWIRDAVFYQIVPDRFARSGRLAKPPQLEAWDTPRPFVAIKEGTCTGLLNLWIILRRLVLRRAT